MYQCKEKRTCEICGKESSLTYYFKYHGPSCKKKERVEKQLVITERLNIYLGLYNKLLEEFGILHNVHINFLNNVTVAALRRADRHYKAILDTTKSLRKSHREFRKEFRNLYPNRLKENRDKGKKENGNNSTTDATEV